MKKLNKFIAFLFACLLLPFSAMAQQAVDTVNNKMSAVHIVLVIIFSGLAVLLLWIDMRLRKIEKLTKNNKK